MPAPTPNDHAPSQRPYMIRALHEWCTDHGFTPYLAVFVDESVQVPLEYVKNSEIVLNISFESTNGLTLGNEFIEFKARFGGVPRDIVVPVDHVVAIYARENGAGMAFPLVPVDDASGADEATPAAAAPAPRSGGLRLASTSPEPESPAAAPAEAAAPADADGATEVVADEDPPEPPRPAGGPRPALKRVK